MTRLYSSLHAFACAMSACGPRWGHWPFVKGRFHCQKRWSGAALVVFRLLVRQVQSKRWRETRLVQMDSILQAEGITINFLWWSFFLPNKANEFASACSTRKCGNHLRCPGILQCFAKGIQNAQDRANAKELDSGTLQQSLLHALHPS